MLFVMTPVCKACALGYPILKNATSTAVLLTNLQQSERINPLAERQIDLLMIRFWEVVTLAFLPGLNITIHLFFFLRQNQLMESKRNSLFCEKENYSEGT